MWGEVLRDEIAGGRLEFKDSYTDEGGAVTKSVQSFEYIDHQNTRQKMKAYIDVASEEPGQVTEGSLMLTDADPDAEHTWFYIVIEKDEIAEKGFSAAMEMHLPGVNNNGLVVVDAVVIAQMFMDRYERRFRGRLSGGDNIYRFLPAVTRMKTLLDNYVETLKRPNPVADGSGEETVTSANHLIHYL